MLCSKKYSMTITNGTAVLQVVLYLKSGFLQGGIGSGEAREAGADVG